MSQIYLADKFGHREKMRHVAELLRSDGHGITSQWIEIDDGTGTCDDPNPDDVVRARGAAMDLAQVQMADTLLAFSYPRSLPNIGGGRHVEFGWALAHDLRVIVVGPRGEHVFHYAEGVEHCETLDEARELLRRIV